MTRVTVRNGRGVSIEETERLSQELTDAVDNQILGRALDRQPTAKELARVREAWAETIELAEAGASGKDAFEPTMRVYQELGLTKLPF